MAQKAEFLANIATDTLALLNTPYMSTFNTILKNVLNKREDASREILLSEIRLGEKDLIDVCQVDEFVAIVWRYWRAAQEGAGHNNLRLLARVIAGQQTAGSFKADEFLHYADIIASLSREEIILIGTLNRIALQVWGDQDEATATNKIYEDSAEELIPRIFGTRREFEATCAALSRHALVLLMDALTRAYMPAPLMRKLCQLASFENLDS